MSISIVFSHLYPSRPGKYNICTLSVLIPPDNLYEGPKRLWASKSVQLSFLSEAAEEAPWYLMTVTHRAVSKYQVQKNSRDRQPKGCGPECELIDTIHLQSRPCCALLRDICNWCQGPINHPVSKRPYNAFYISTYVESKRVCHQCKPLSEKEVFWRPFPV